MKVQIHSVSLLIGLFLGSITAGSLVWASGGSDRADEWCRTKAGYLRIATSGECRRSEAPVDLPRGPQGEQGIQGERGTNGADGLSAYDLWVGQGNTGTVIDFLQSLEGPTGASGPTGPQGPAGATVANLAGEVHLVDGSGQDLGRYHLGFVVFDAAQGGYVTGLCVDSGETQNCLDLKAAAVVPRLLKQFDGPNCSGVALGPDASTKPVNDGGSHMVETLDLVNGKPSLYGYSALDDSAVGAFDFGFMGRPKLSYTLLKLDGGRKYTARSYLDDQYHCQDIATSDQRTEAFYGYLPTYDQLPQLRPPFSLKVG